jgi:hypothetical protein
MYARTHTYTRTLAHAQLGLTFCDAQGRLPLVDGFFCVWQFNFREFNVHEDVYAQDSIELLRHSGIDFKAHNERGIDVHKFGELIMVRARPLFVLASICCSHPFSPNADTCPPHCICGVCLAD